MKTIEVTVTKAGEVTISDEELKPGMVLQLREITPKVRPFDIDPRRPLRGVPLTYIDPMLPCYENELVELESPVRSPLVADAEHPLWGAPLIYIDPTRPLDPEDWGNLAS
jgi:hypothetical protein